MWYALCEVPTTSPSGTPAVSVQVCRCSLSPRGDGNLNILTITFCIPVITIGLDAFLMVSGLIDPAEAAVKTFHIFAMVLLCGFSVSAYLQAKLYKKVFERLEAVSRTVPETIEAGTSRIWIRCRSALDIRASVPAA